MTTNTVEDLDASIGNILENEFSRISAGDGEDASKRAVMPVAEGAAFDSAARLPRRIAGGFRGLGDDLDRRARDWRNMVRLLERQRPQLETAEAEHDRLHEALGRLVPDVQESGRALKAMLDSTKAGDVSGDLAAQFTRSQAALDELEGLAEALTGNLQEVRSIWEQYARTVIRAQKMREELRQNSGER